MDSDSQTVLPRSGLAYLRAGKRGAVMRSPLFEVVALEKNRRHL